MFNRRRREWELPGGMIDPGETPRQAAIRELHEETGYEVEQLAFAGYARFAFGAEQRPEYAAVFTAHTPPPQRRDFVPNEEISAVCWWDRTQPLDERVDRMQLGQDTFGVRVAQV